LNIRLATLFLSFRSKGCKFIEDRKKKRARSSSHRLFISFVVAILRPCTRLYRWSRLRAHCVTFRILRPPHLGISVRLAPVILRQQNISGDTWPWYVFRPSFDAYWSRIKVLGARSNFFPHELRPAERSFLEPSINSRLCMPRGRFPNFLGCRKNVAYASSFCICCGLKAMAGAYVGPVKLFDPLQNDRALEST